MEFSVLSKRGLTELHRDSIPTSFTPHKNWTHDRGVGWIHTVFKRKKERKIKEKRKENKRKENKGKNKGKKKGK